MNLCRDTDAFVDQDRIGGSDNPPGERGNCLQACLASLLDLSLFAVPHFSDTDESAEEQHAAKQRWCAEQGWCAVWVPWDWLHSGWVTLPRNALVIVSGKSPRGDWAHVVVGTITETGWRVVHDPHPSRAGLEGEPYGIHLLAPLPYIVGAH